MIWSDSSESWYHIKELSFSLESYVLCMLKRLPSDDFRCYINSSSKQLVLNVLSLMILI